MQQYCLQWNDYQSSMISGFSSFLKSETLVDVTLAAEGRYVQAHKVLLSACSSYFQALFTVNPCKHPIVILKDVRFADLQTLLNFMYYGEVIASQDQLPSILKTAEMLEIKGLVKVTVENLVPNQVASDVIELKAPVQITRIVGGVPEQSIPSSPSLSPSRRRKRSRRSSAGSDSGLREHPPNESLSTSNELIASTVVETLIKNEPDETNLNESWEFDLHDESYEIVKEDLSDFHSDQIMLHLPKYEMHEALESSTMEFGDPGPSTSAEDPQPTEQPVGGEPSDNEAQTSKAGLLSDRSRAKYELPYEKFEKWCAENNIIESANEEVLLTYFENLSKMLKPTSTWAYYSMIKHMISTKKNVDISKYTSLVTFLKTNSEGYRSKKSRTLTRLEISKFLKEADNARYLQMKVALIIGLAGGCGREELTNLLSKDVTDGGQFFRFVLQSTKTNKLREFFVTPGDIDDLNMVEIIRNYISLRPSNTDHDRFFVTIRNGKCTKQPVGINKFGSLPKDVATFLNLANPEEYTGHCFKRSSTSLIR